MALAESERQEILTRLQGTIEYVFQNQDLAVQALTHSSAKDKDVPCNERLEFLGDAILGQIISEYLFENFPEYEEGDLSTMKSILVSSKTLSQRAQEVGIDHCVILGRGLTEKKSLPRSILCNVFEALLAAIYLDGGIAPARDFVLKNIKGKLHEILKDEHEKNYKSLLQDYAQRNLATIPTYRVTKEIGPDHRKMFQVVVELDSRIFGPAWGSNKKDAEQRAAKTALEDLGVLASNGSGESRVESRE